MFKKQKPAYFRFIIAFVFFFSCQLSYSSVTDINADDFFKSVVGAIDDNIPSIDDVISGYHPSNGTLPSLLIANFSGQTEKESSLGMALGDIVRFDMAAATSDQILMPAYETFQRDWHSAFYGIDKGKRPDGLARLADMWGVGNALDGTISIRKNEFAWLVTMTNLKTGAVLASQSFKGKLDQLPGAIERVKHFALATLPGVTADGWVAEPTTGIASLASLNKYAEFLSYRNNHGKENVLRRALSLWEEGFQAPAVGVAIIEYMRPDFDNPGLYESTMSSVDVKFHSSSIKSLYLLQRGLFTRSQDTDNYISELKFLARAHPNDPEILLSLSMLMEERGEELNALAILREMAVRWRGIFYVWSTTSFAIYDYAWLIRGQEYWNKVPEEAKYKFTRLIDLANRSAETCSLVSHDHPVCISAKLKTEVGYSDELIRLFDTATDIEPFVETPYRISLIYSENKWGGSRQAREYILKKAWENNPDAKWVEKLRINYASDVHGRGWYIWLILALVILLTGGTVIYRRLNN